jgi:phosphoribosylformylglycinamidine synthase subunit PurSL
MGHRIEIGLIRGVPDPRGDFVRRQAQDLLGIALKRCATRDVYQIGVALDRRRLAEIRRAFADPVIARAASPRLPPPARFDWLLEIGYKPGVTDNVGRTAESVLEDMLDRKLTRDERVATLLQVLISAPDRERSEIERVGTELLANPLIQTVSVFSADEWRASEPEVDPPPAGHREEIRVRTFDLSGSDADLARISADGILSLSLDEMRAIREFYRRPGVRDDRRRRGLPEWPTDLELECIAQTWSEHCFHKIFAGTIRYRDETGREETIRSLYKTYIQAATGEIRKKIDWLVSVFTDNAGILRFNDDVHIAYKVETHNSPSALDPYGGAMTGIVGVNRDPMGTGMGCRLLCNVWGYCLGSPFHADPVPEGLMHPRRIRDGVHQGVIDGGNQSGIPWMRGFERFDRRYVGKPLVYCGTVGVIPVEVAGGPSERKEIRPGDRLVVAGGRTGKDGIHGATFSSEELRGESPAQAVQIGDPITQRKLYDFLMEARDRGLFRCITDNGAGGLSCSAGEMGRLSGGVDLDLARAPLKYEGLQPWEIFLSEAQERMTLAVPPETLDAFLELARRRDVEAADLGAFTDDGLMIVRHGERLVGCLDMEFLYESGCPVMTMDAAWSPPAPPAPRPARRGSRTGALRDLLGRLNVCSREFKSRMYDGEVKGLSVIKPFVGAHSDVPSDASVMRVAYDRDDGIALAEGINPFYSDIDTYAMTASVIDEAVRRILSVGGRLDRIAGLDNFCWPDPVQSDKTPDGRYKLAQLVRANRALYDLTTAYGVPCISGKDSMKNDSTRGGVKISIPPTLLFSTIGRIEDVRRCVTMDVKRAGDFVYVAGRTRDELGASEYWRMLAERQGRPGAIGSTVPRVDPESALPLYRALERALERGLARSCHTPTLGGLAAAFALAALGGDLGMDIDLTAVPADPGLDDDALLFSESNSRFVLTCRPEDAADLEVALRGTAFARVGTVMDEGRLRIAGARGNDLVRGSIESFRKAFKGTLDGI